SVDDAVSQSVSAALADDSGIRVEAQSSTLAQMNGRAIKMMSDHDIVLFQTSPDDEADLGAIKSLVEHKRPDSILIALANGDISLSQARALNHAGVDEVLPIATVATEIVSQVARLARKTQHSPAAQSRAGKIIAVVQARGGAGSTTVAVNLADQLAGKKTRGKQQNAKAVALIDFDLQFGTVGTMLDLGEQDALLQLALNGTIPDANFLAQSMVDLPNGLSVLASPSALAPLDSLQPEQVAAILDTLRDSHDYIVLDLPRALVGWIEPIVQRADELIIVTDISVTSVRHCRRLIEFFTTDNGALPIEIVVNHEKRPWFQSSMQKEAAKALDRKFNHWLPHDPRAASAAADSGKSLMRSAPRSQLSKAMARLAKSTKLGFETQIRQQKNQETGSV
ncbi:MAG: AAA family ATPase, partial [Paracoccaceae bacterium]|nr:AAA family ATPase [Paracoccaceae bacterium]